MSQEEIKDVLEEELRDKKEHLAGLKSAAQAEFRLQQIAGKIEQLQKKLDDVQQRESNRRWQLQNQLDEAVAAPLRSVEPGLLTASPGQTLDEPTREVIEAFAGLFEKRDNGFKWFDTEFPAKPGRPEDFAGQRQRLQGELNGLLKEQSELSDVSGKEQDRPRLIDRTAKEISALEKDLDTLSRYPAAALTLQEANQEKRDATEKLAKLDEKERLEKERQDAVQQKVGEAKAGKERIEERHRDLEAIARSVKAVEHRFPHLERAEAEHPLAVEQVSVVAFDDLQAQLYDLEQVRRDILEGLRRFADHHILDDLDGELQKDSPTASVIREAFKGLTDLFASLDGRWDVLRKQIAIHNETVASYRQALTTNDEHIARFEAQLNRELEGVRINDLVEIRVDIHKDPKFRNLVEEASGIDPFGSQLQSDAFYDRLRVFVADFFGEQGGSKRLTMDKVITGISYSTRKENATRLDRKGQSTSTTALINLELVYRLLKRVLYPGVSLSFPLVLDELASVDISQVPSLLDRLGKQGFNLFSAATHSASAEIIYLIGRYLEVGQMRTARPYSTQRTLVFWGGPEGFTGDESLSHWADHTQNSLLEADGG